MVLSNRIKNNIELFSNKNDFTDDKKDFKLLCSDITGCLSKKIAAVPIWFEYSKEEQDNIIVNYINNYISENTITISSGEKGDIEKYILNLSFGFGPLDSLLSNPNIKRVIVNDTDNIYFVQNDNTAHRADITIDKSTYSSLIKKICRIAGDSQTVSKCKINNFLIYVYKSSDSDFKIIIEKTSDCIADFKYLKDEWNIDDEILLFLKNILKNRLSIIISDSSYDNSKDINEAFINEVMSDYRTAFLGDSSAFMITNQNTFDAENLNHNQVNMLLKYIKLSMPEYIFSYNIPEEITSRLIKLVKEEALSVITTITSENPASAITMLANNTALDGGISEKHGKRYIAEFYDYLIQTDTVNDKKIISSVHALSTNKVGNLSMKEILKYDNNAYTYNADDLKITKKFINTNKDAETSVRKIPFSARFSD